MSKRNDILESTDKIDSYIGQQNFEDFKNDPKTIDAVVRNLEIIGEAANQIPDDLKQKFPSIKWRQIDGVRNRIVHEYFGVDLQIVWKVIKRDLKKFEDKLRQIREGL